MGANSSTGISYEQLADSTNDTRQMMSLILEYMMHELTLRDFISLSDPQQCKKYVLVMANHLYDQFYKLQITPDHDRHGVLIFRSVRDLADPLNEEQRKEKQSLCLILSYFYTRIFQIYGALAITMIDDANFMEQSGLLHRALHRGGATPTEDLGNFEWIRNYLKSNPQRLGYKMDYRGEAKGTIYFMLENLTYTPYSKDKGIFYIVIDRHIIRLDVESKQTTAQREPHYSFSFRSLRTSSGSDIPRPSFLPPHILIEYHDGNYYVRIGASKPVTIDTYLDRTLSHLIYDIRSHVDAIRGDVLLSDFDSRSGRNTRRNTLRNTLRNTFRNTRRNSRYTTERDTGYTTRRPAPYITSFDTRRTRRDRQYDPTVHQLGDRREPFQRDDSRSAEPLRMNKIIRSLKERRPLGHCIARARQLLEAIPLEGEPGITHICDARFYSAHAPGRTQSGERFEIESGVPKPGESLDRHVGLSTAALLFYDAVEVHTPKLVIGTEPKNGKLSSVQQYIAFMKELAKLYETDRSPRTEDSFRTGLASIRSTRDTRRCSIQHAATIPSHVVEQVKGVVYQLYKTQLDHAAECYRIMQMLFDFRNLPRIDLNDRLLQEGFPELDRINQAAREVLSRYYVNCETKYIQGTNLMLQEHVISPLALSSTPAALPSALPSALPAALPSTPSRAVRFAPQVQPPIAPRVRPTVAPRTAPMAAPRAAPMAAPRAAPSSNVNSLSSRFWSERLPTTKYGTIHTENRTDILFNNNPEGEFYYLSSFYTRPVAEGVYPRLFIDTNSRPPIPYTSVEQYMAAKMIEHFFAEAPNEKATLLQTILSVRITPEYANRLIDRIKSTLEPDEMLQWYGLRGQMDGLADTTMKQANLLKFDQNRDLRKKLLETSPRHLYYEGNPIWGIGPRTDRSQWGQNRLGNILEYIRSRYLAYFKQEGTDEALEAQYKWNDQDMTA